MADRRRRRRRGSGHDENGFVDTLIELARASPRVGAAAAAVLALSAAVVHFALAKPMLGLNDLLAALLLLLAVVAGAVSGIEAIRRRLTPRSADPPPPGRPAARQAGPMPYRRRFDFVTPTEAAFYHVLVTAAGPDVTVLVKVRWADLVYLPRRTWGHHRWLSRLAQKHVDFVLCHRATLQPFLLVELDDPSHDRPDRAARDRFVDEVATAAELPLEHVRAAPSYDAAAVAQTVRRHRGQSHAARPPTRTRPPQP